MIRSNFSDSFDASSLSGLLGFLDFKGLELMGLRVRGRRSG